MIYNTYSNNLRKHKIKSPCTVTNINKIYFIVSGYSKIVYRLHPVVEIKMIYPNYSMATESIIWFRLDTYLWMYVLNSLTKLRFKTRFYLDTFEILEK